MAKIGIYGGSFNPPHLGHLLAAEACRQQLGLDRVLLIPAAVPPHKALAEGSPDAETRLLLTRLAAQDHPGFEVSDLELRREGPSYTVDTLQTLHEMLPDDELYLMMGTDMYLSFQQWRQPEKIAELATLVCFSRYEQQKQELLVQQKHLEEVYGRESVVLLTTCMEISSTEIRRLLTFDCADSYLSPAVLQEIRARRLYGWGRELRGLDYDRLRAESLALHKQSRMAHAEGCAETAAALAERYGADAVLARRAGILHDVTKALTPEQQAMMAARWGAPLTPEQLESPQLLHAVTGALAAEKLFGECDAVVQAIRTHTTGAADMTLLQKILYIADYVEPTRSFPGVEALRAAVRRDLDEGVMQGLASTLELLASRGQTASRETQEALEFLKRKEC